MNSSILSPFLQGNWSPANLPTNYGNVLSSASLVVNSKLSWIAVGENGNILTASGSPTKGWVWIKEKSPEQTTYNKVTCNDASATCIIVGNNGKITKAVNSNNNWSISEKNSSTTQTLHGVTYEKLLDRWIAVGNSGTILVSDDDGDSWRAPQPPNSTAKQFNFLNIITDNGSSGLLMVVGSYIKPNYPEGLFSAILTTYNAGGDWQTQYNVPGVCVYAVAFNPQDKVFMAIGNGTFVSSDYGLHWTHLFTSHNDFLLYDIVYSDNGSVWFAAGQKGNVTESPDNGVHWNKLGSMSSNITLYGITKRIVNHNGQKITYLITSGGINTAAAS
ncbi:WD40/YVTN/BNR-like repeat-containing protein [Piscirickettsia salmonis]|uniref:WD40/YVTN/BNR-like repeat-containing protein n=3 Tax=Piscirickettsia salmonis TaxID=1238 RepID=UPI0012B99515|nr:hypothetical protein [Piscirickettsia salmonis]